VLITQKSAVINHELLPVVVGSPILLYQLFYNLINNSLKFSKAGVPPLISLKSESTMGIDLNLPNIKANQAYEKITLQDSGIGFSQTRSKRFFKLFYGLIQKTSMKEPD
jgi:signal transduction histidine kinase